jgi:hypothetical protein
MPLLGKAAVAMWWDIAPADRIEFEDWHSHEHFPERLSIPGFLRGSRWASADGGSGYFVMYELQAYDTLCSTAYLGRLNDPTPWSLKMMPKHRNMIRSQCQVVESHGGGTGGFLLTIRLSPAPGRAEALRAHLQGVMHGWSQRPGIAACHLLQTKTPPIASTTEQRIRGGTDQVADWILLASGYDADVLRRLQQDEFGAMALSNAGAAVPQAASLHRLSLAMIGADL